MEAAIRSYDALLARFGEAVEPDVREQIRLALQNKSIAAFDGAASATEPAVREQVAGTLFKKAAVLDELDRDDEAVSVLDELIDRFETSENPEISRVVQTATSERFGPTSGLQA